MGDKNSSIHHAAHHGRTQSEHPPRRGRRDERRGMALVMFLLFLLPLIAFLALAIDLGMLTIARTQCQNAADAAALAGVRTLNGSTQNNNNYAAVTPEAQQVAVANTVLSTPLQASQINVQIGRYVYDTTNQKFVGQFPGPATDNWSMVQAKVSVDVSKCMAFSRALGLQTPVLQTTATAVHRPRDISIILDYSGSMRFASYAGVPNWPSFIVNNPDTLVPQFGHYSAAGAGSMYATSFNLPYSAANITTTTSDGRPPICGDFYQDSSGTPAFTLAPASYATTPGGDNFLLTNKNTGGSYAHTVAEVLGISAGSVTNKTYDASFESSGYRAYNMTSAFNGYTQGPGYYGKTFFVWPPDPTNDWRKKYFTYPGSATPMDDNSQLWSPSGVWQPPNGANYAINYAAILQFIKTVGPNPFPASMQSGRIVYYTAIPDTISGSPPGDLNQRFWKDYIDYVLGLMDQGGWNYMDISNGQMGLTGYGSDFNWGSVLITAKSQLKGGNKTPYMYYNDNPQRPKLNFWFGPLTMIDFLDNYTMMYVANPAASRYCWWPGTCHEAPMYGCKLGIQAALTDINNNHPNDWVSLIMFSVPKQSAGDTSGARFNGARVGMGQNYQNMQDSLWYPPATVGNPGATVTPYDANNLEVPRAFGGTCYAMPLMLAYNQFSASTACQSFATPAGIAGGNGRKGAQKIIIFETDGAPNTTASASLVNGGPYQSYYKVRYSMSNPGGSEYPSGIGGYNDNDPTVTSQIFNLCTQICAPDNGSPAGYSSGPRKVLIHCIGFGPMFDPASSEAASNTATLNQMQTIGNVTDGMPSYKIIYGNQTTVINDLQQAFSNILESTVPVSLIQ